MPLQVVVRSDAGIRMPKDLEGKRLGLTRISVLFSVLERGCATYGCDISKMTLVNMQPQEIVLAYERGNVDAVLTNEPWTTYVVQRGGKLLFTAAQSAVPGREGLNRIDGIYTAVFARPDFIAQHPKAAQGILKGLSQAAEWVKANPKEAAEIIGKEINIPTDAVVATLSRVDSKLEMTADWASEFDKKAEYLLGLKELRRKVVASDVFQPEPLKAVCGACASYK